MGKSGKQRKRLRLLRQQNGSQNLPGISQPAHSDGSSSDEDAPNVSSTKIDAGLSGNNKQLPKIPENDLAATLRTLHFLGENLDLFRSPAMKILRSAMQPFVEEQLKRSKAGKESNSIGNLSGKKRTKDPGPPVNESDDHINKIRFGSKVKNRQMNRRSVTYFPLERSATPFGTRGGATL